MVDAHFEHLFYESSRQFINRSTFVLVLVLKANGSANFVMNEKIY